METALRLSGIGEYYFSTKLREIDSLNRMGKHIINLGIGSPDLPPHQKVINKLTETSLQPNMHGYQSYMGSPVLRQAIADWYRKWYRVDLNPDNEVLPLIGSKEGIMHICMAFLNEGDRVLVPNPGYPTYRSAVHLAGGKCLDYSLTEENGFLPDWKALEKMDKKGIRMMFVNYPHMPTGKRPTMQLFEEIIDFGRENNILIIHDNPYSFILNDQPLSILGVDGAKDVAIELNSLSKSHNMAGWRVGMLVGAAKTISQVLQFKSNMDSGMFLPLQLAAAEALQLEQDWMDNLNSVYSERRAYAYKLLDLVGCTYSKDQSGLFVWANIAQGYKNCYDLSDKILYDANVFITPGGIFGSNGEAFVRLSLCTPVEKFDIAISRIKEIAL